MIRGGNRITRRTIRRRSALQRVDERGRQNTKKLNKLLKSAEVKFTDKNVDDAIVSSTGSVQAQILVVPIGDSQSTRHGRKILLTSVQWHGVVTLPSSATIESGSDTCRLMMLKDTSANGALPAVTRYGL